MADVDVSQLVVASVAESLADIDVSQLAVSAVVNYPSEFAQTSQLQVTALTNGGNLANTSQLSVIAVVKGVADNPQVRAWTFALDGHDFYVLRLGDTETLVYDLYSEEWVNWSSPFRNTWRTSVGTNWVGGSLYTATYGSNILAGDDAFGLVWFLNPDQPYDEHPDHESAEQQLYFTRTAMGQVAVVGRAVEPCYVIHLSADPGEPAYTDAAVTLYTSDNSGQTFNNHGAIPVTSGEYTTPQLSWYSLGQITAPGRLFKIEDDGAIARIDSMDMNDGDR